MDKIDWQNYFLGLAFCVAQRSSDSQTKHGCILVDSKTNQILSVGYNGFPRNCKDDANLPHVRPLKHQWMVHSECNSIFNCRLKSQDMTAYVTGQCCPNCLLSLYQFGVQTVVMADSHGSFLIGENDLKWEKEFVEQTGIVLKKVRPNLDWLTSVVEGRAGEFIQEKDIVDKIKEVLDGEEKQLNESFIGGVKRVCNYWLGRKNEDILEGCDDLDYIKAHKRDLIILDKCWKGLNLSRVKMRDVTQFYLSNKEFIPKGYSKIYLTEDKDGPVFFCN